MGKVKKTGRKSIEKVKKKEGKYVGCFSSVVGFSVFLISLWILTDYIPLTSLLGPDEWFIYIGDTYTFLSMLSCSCFALAIYKLIKEKWNTSSFFFSCSIVFFAVSVIGWISPDKVGEKSLERGGRVYKWEDVHYVNVHWDGEIYYVIHFRNGKDINVFMNDNQIPLLEKLDNNVKSKHIPVVIGNRPTINELQQKNMGVQKMRIIRQIFYRY
ncbi:hypothetical protein [Shimazuella kribbensis]|uniref:hypothetical protein n=1 Tax=Shimazuella kribbensis TaxID=139808 RepID=UPI00041640D4|nr:hypothetical protein [Shimazuella kribbensis]